MEEGACLRQADSSFCARLERKINNGASKRNEYLDNIKPLAFVTWLNHEGFIFPEVLFLLCSYMLWLVNSSCSNPSFWSPALEEEGHHGHWPKNSGHYSPPQLTWVALIGEGGYSWAVSRYYFWKSRLPLQILQLLLLGLGEEKKKRKKNWAFVSCRSIFTGPGGLIAKILK